MIIATLILFLSSAMAEEPVAPAAEPVAAEAAPAEVVVAAPAEVAAPVEATPPTVPEVKVPETAPEAVEQGKDAFSAFKAGQWGIGIVLILGVLAFLYKKFKKPATPK